MFLLNVYPRLTKVALVCGLLIVQGPWQTGRAASGGVTGDVSCEGDAVGITIDIDGEIDASTLAGVTNLFELYRQQRTKVASGYRCEKPSAQPDFSAYGEHFGINSHGGNVEAAMAIGRMLRREGAWLGVDGVCYSACVLILAGAVDRHIGRSGQVGIHRPYFQSSPDKPVEADQLKQAYSRVLAAFGPFVIF